MPDDTQFEEGTGPGPANVPLAHDPTDLSTGKHALLMVPDFKNAAMTGGAPMTSYLRLGDAHSQAGPAVSTGPAAHPVRSDLGEDLASMVQGFTDDLRDRAGGTGDDAAPLESFPIPPGAPPGTTAPPAGTSLDVEQRRAESRRLHSKGGWRDHSDGNRITTTRGDKIEVIRGNYKLLVLGRSDGFGNAAGVEMSGGNVDTSSEDLAFASGTDNPAGMGPDATRNVAALQTTFEWFTDPDGGDGHWGWRQTTKTGHPDHPLGSNGQVITKTWVDLSQTDMGSPEQWVRKIINTTYVTDIEETINAGTSTEVLNASTSNQTVNAGTVNQWINSSGTLTNGIAVHSIDNRTTAALSSSLSAVAIQSSLQAVGVNVIGNAYSMQLEADISDLLYAAVQIIPIVIDAQIADLILTQFIATCIDNHTGVHVDNHTSLHMDNHAGVHLDLHYGTHAQLDNGNPITLTVGNSFDIGMGMRVELTNSVATVTNASHMQVATTHFKL